MTLQIDVSQFGGGAALTNNSVTNLILSDSPGATLKGNPGASAGDPADIPIGRNLRVVDGKLDAGDNLYYLFKIAVSPVNPAAKHIRFDTTNVATITTMRVHTSDNNLVAQSVRIGLIKAGHTLSLVSITNPNTILSLWSVTANPVLVVDAVDGDYYNIAVSHIGGAIPTVGLDPCELRHFPAGSSTAVTEAAIIAAGNFARFASNGAGGYHMLDNLGNIVESVASVYALPGITISGVPTLPAANTVPTGTSVMLHKDNFIGQGATTVGVRVIADSANNLWRPDGPQVLFSSQFGSIATPSLTLAAPGRYNVGVDPKIPAALLYAGARVRFPVQFYSLNATATTGPTVRVFVGDDLVTYTNNAAIFNNALSSANPGSTQTDTLLRFLTGTTGISNRSQFRGGGGGTGGLQDVPDPNGNLVAANQMMVTYDLSALGTATGVHLMDYQIIWEG